MSASDFYTLRGYNRRGNPEISAAMEDYLEMICRLIKKGETVRVNHLASLLNVTPPSSSKMIAKLRDSGMVEFEPYGVVTLTQRGMELGEYLLYRHDVLQRFFCHVNDSDSELELVEKIEHFFDERTVASLERILASLYRDSSDSQAD